MFSHVSFRDIEVQAVIAAGGNTSNVVNIDGAAVIGICMPAVWDSADVGILAAPEEAGPFGPLKDEGGNVVVLKATASDRVSMGSLAIHTAWLKYLKFVSCNATPTTTVNQTAAAVLRIVGKA